MLVFGEVVDEDGVVGFVLPGVEVVSVDFACTVSGVLFADVSKLVFAILFEVLNHFVIIHIVHLVRVAGLGVLAVLDLLEGLFISHALFDSLVEFYVTLGVKHDIIVSLAASVFSLRPATLVELLTHVLALKLISGILVALHDLFLFIFDGLEECLVAFEHLSVVSLLCLSKVHGRVSLISLLRMCGVRVHILFNFLLVVVNLKIDVVLPADHRLSIVD